MNSPNDMSPFKEVNKISKHEFKNKNGEVLEALIDDGDENLDLIPTGSGVVIKRYVIRRTKSGIELPDHHSMRLSEGIVKATGPSARVKPGDIVLFGKEVPTDITRNGEQYAILYDSQIEAIIDKKKTKIDYLIKEER